MTLRDGSLTERLELLRAMVHRGVFCDGLPVVDALDVEDLLGDAMAVIAEAAVERLSPAGVPIPRTADEAAAMAIVGEQWLRQNAPDRLRPEARDPPAK